MRKKTMICGAICIILFFSFFSFAAAHRDDPSMRKLLGIQPKPQQKIPQPASLLVSVINSDTGAFVDANVGLYRLKNAEKGKEDFKGELIQVKGTRGKHAYFEKISVGKNEKGEYEQEFVIEINALDYEFERRFITLREGEYQEVRVWLEKRKKYDLCKETDRGVDPLKPGTATYNPVPKLPEKLQKQEDKCKDNNVIESYCSEKDTLESVELKCPGVCKDGKCVAEPYCAGKKCVPLEKLRCSSSMRGDDRVNPFLQSGLALWEINEISEVEDGAQKERENAPPQVIPGKNIQGKVVADSAAAAGGGGGVPRKEVLLEIGVFGEGTGSVSTADGKITSCTFEKSPCKAVYPEGTEIRIFAKPEEWSKVGTFNPCKQDSPNECVVVMDGNKRVSVRFDEVERPLRVEMKSSCIDATRVKHFFCSPYIALPEKLGLGWKAEKNIPEIPRETVTSCPSSYSCFAGRCVQRPRTVIATAGDANGDGLVNVADVEYMKNLLARGVVPYEAKADFDGDGLLTRYDLYRTEHLVAGDIPKDVTLPVRELSLSMSDQALVGADNLLGNLAEGMKRWRVEVSQKGASRMSCRPIVMNIEFPRRDQFPGMTTYAGFGTLNYKKLRFIPDCDILRKHEVNNLLREYIIYSTMRREGVPAVDVAGFARVTLTSADKDIDHSTPYEYMFLQRDKEDKDQIPFMQQFGFSQVLENPLEPFNRVDYAKSNSFIKIVLQNVKDDDGEKIVRVEKEFLIDPITSARYWIITQLFDLGDHGVFGNEDYGLDAQTGFLKNIPYDMDSSFDCELGAPYPEGAVEGLDASKKAAYYAHVHRVARELFDNPDMLNRMLLLVDKFPFADNKDKMKRTLELRFLYHALYFGSNEFSQKLGQTHVPYKNNELYVKEAKRILDMKTFDTMCGTEEHHSLEKFFEGKSGGGGGGGGGDRAPPAAAPAVPVPKL